jgi:Fur family peroxide stress response transcriptional regulator
MMDHLEKQRRIEEFERQCGQLGIPCTMQRRVILEILLDEDGHPNADQVFQTLRKRYHGISRATVHRTLETLVQMGVITKACHPGKIIRYDARLQNHHHLLCVRCEKIIDFQDQTLDSLPIPDTSALGFQATGVQVQLRGICKECRQKS